MKNIAKQLKNTFIKPYLLWIAIAAFGQAWLTFDVVKQYQLNTLLMDKGQVATAQYLGYRKAAYEFSKNVDYSINLGFFNSYTQKEREALIDLSLAKIKRIQQQGSAKVIYLNTPKSKRVYLLEEVQHQLTLGFIAKRLMLPGFTVFMIFGVLWLNVTWRAKKSAELIHKKSQGRLGSDNDLSETETVPEPVDGFLYRWTCQACDKSNLANAANCQHCGCPSNASTKDIKRYQIQQTQK